MFFLADVKSINVSFLLFRLFKLTMRQERQLAGNPMSFKARAGLKTRGTNDKDQEASEDSFECIPYQKNMLKDSIMFYHCQSGSGDEYQKRRVVLTKVRILFNAVSVTVLRDLLPLLQHVSLCVLK
jgi:hypothetical protein